MTATAVDAAYKALKNCRFRFSSEDDLQRGISGALTAAGILHDREWPLTASERLDFWLPGVGVAIEVKIHGAVAPVVAQLQRYAVRPEVNAILLVTSRSSLRGVPETLCGKPVRVLHLQGSML